MIFIVIALASFTASAQDGNRVDVATQGGLQSIGFISLPISDAGEISSFGIGLDVKYLFPVSYTLSLGVATGYANYFIKDIELNNESIELDDEKFVPIAATAQYDIFNKLSVGLDIGYVISLGDIIDDGFYYRPVINYSISEKIMLNFSYSVVGNENLDWSTINLGLKKSF